MANDYDRLREQQERWFDLVYDTGTVEAIRRIPLNAQDAPGYSGGTSTGTVDMYLRRRAFRLEEDGELVLAVACLHRSNEIRFYRRRGYRREDYYAFVRLLVRCGCVDAARREKQKIDDFFGDYIDDTRTLTWSASLRSMPRRIRRERAAEMEVMREAWDRVVEDELVRTNRRREYEFIRKELPDLCPKSQSAYTRAKGANSAKYQQIQAAVMARGLSLPEELR